MNIEKDLSRIGSVFFDTAPIIYYIEGHDTYGPLMKQIDGILSNYMQICKISKDRPHFPYMNMPYFFTLSTDRNLRKMQ